MSFDGVQVSIGDRMAPLVTVLPTMIVAQIPYDVPAGQQRVVVTSNSISSAAFTVTVSPTAPALNSLDGVPTSAIAAEIGMPVDWGGRAY